LLRQEDGRGANRSKPSALEGPTEHTTEEVGAKGAFPATQRYDSCCQEGLHPVASLSARSVTHCGERSKNSCYWGLNLLGRPSFAGARNQTFLLASKRYTPMPKRRD
jgi:hypothetical protein